MGRLEDYHALREGDLVRVTGANAGIVTKILEYGQVQIFWPATNKFSTHGKKWAEIHLEILSEGR